jgi:hypothetical protein
MNTETAMAEFVEETHNRRLVITNGGRGKWKWEITEKHTKYRLCSGTIDPGYYEEDVLRMVLAINGSFGPYKTVSPVNEADAIFDDTWYKIESYQKTFGSTEVMLLYLQERWVWILKDVPSDTTLCGDALPAGQSCEAALAEALNALSDWDHTESDRKLPAAHSEPSYIDVMRQLVAPKVP